MTAKMLGPPKASLDNWVRLNAKSELKDAGNKPVTALRPRRLYGISLPAVCGSSGFHSHHFSCSNPVD